MLASLSRRLEHFEGFSLEDDVRRGQALHRSLPGLVP